MNSIFLLTGTQRYANKLNIAMTCARNFVFVCFCYESLFIVFSLTITYFLHTHEYKINQLRINQTNLLQNGSTETLLSYFRTFCLNFLFMFAPDDKICFIFNYPLLCLKWIWLTKILTIGQSINTNHSKTSFT